MIRLKNFILGCICGGLIISGVTYLYLKKNQDLLVGVYVNEHVVDTALITSDLISGKVEKEYAVVLLERHLQLIKPFEELSINKKQKEYISDMVDQIETLKTAISNEEELKASIEGLIQVQKDYLESRN